MNQTTDKWSLGGHEFTSRFILGSGKFSLDLVKACVENAGTEIVTLAIRRANEGGLANILDYIPENVPCCQILPVQEPQRRLFALQSFPESLAAVIL